LSETKNAQAPGWLKDRRLGHLVRQVAAEASRRFPGLHRRDLALTLLVAGSDEVRGASYRGGKGFYPASIVKLFYLTAIHAWLEAGKLSLGADLTDAISAMIGRSSNDATSHIVDLLTGTTGGPAMPPRPLKRWLGRRRAINRYFARWHCPEFAGINLAQKTWGEAPYGRERQSVSPRANGRNILTSDAVARLLLAIERGEAVSRSRSAAMMKLLARDIHPGKSLAPFDQIHGFFGEGLPPGALLWSKAGWTGQTKHDAAIVELAGGRRFILVAFSAGARQAGNPHLLPFIARRMASGIAAMKGA
jgi:beta-lactamase class A